MPWGGMNLSKNSGDLMPGVKAQRGAVFVEALLVIPLLLLIVGATIEFSRALRLKKIVASLSKETANLVFRECADLKTLVTTPCLPMAQHNMQNFANQIVSGSVIAVRVEAPDINGNSFDVTEPNGTKKRDGSTPVCSTHGSGAAFSASREVTVCGYARIPYQPIVPFLKYLLGNVLNVSGFEDETVI